MVNDKKDVILMIIISITSFLLILTGATAVTPNKLSLIYENTGYLDEDVAKQKKLFILSITGNFLSCFFALQKFDYL